MQTNLEMFRSTSLAEQHLLCPCLGGSRAPHGAGCLPWNAFLPRKQKPKLPLSQPARPYGFPWLLLARAAEMLNPWEGPWLVLGWLLPSLEQHTLVLSAPAASLRDV